MKSFAHTRVLFLFLALVAFGNSSDLTRRASGAALAQGESRLTQEIFDQFLAYWEYYLDLKVTPAEREELKRGVIKYWATNDTTNIQATLDQAKQGANLSLLPESAHADMLTAYQGNLVNALRKETDDPVSVVLLRAFNRAHGFGGAAVDRAGADAVLTPGNPPLTQAMADKFISLYAFIFDLNLSAAQHGRLQSLLVEAWKKNDREVIDRVVGDLKSVGDESKDELVAQLGADYQNTFVEGFRRGGMQTPLLKAFVELFDEAHPDRIAATHAKGLADLVGTWEWDDALLQDRDPYSGTVRGIGYVEAGKLEISPNGQFKLIRTHRHCAGACCNEQGKSEYGTISVDKNGELVFQINSGTEMARDGCNAGANQQSAIKPHRESYPWSIRLNALHNNAPTLCWNTEPGKAVCYIKQQ